MSAFVKAMRFVGDLDDEFYADERQREVGNEAAAVGYQALNWALVIAAAILPWTAGRTGAWIAMGLLIAWALVGLMVMLYSRALDLDLYAVTPLWTLRSIVMSAVYLVGAVGVLMRLVADDAATWSGVWVGMAAGAAGAGFGIWRNRRNARRAEAELEAKEASDF